MIGKSTACACLVPLSDLFGNGVPEATIEAEGWIVHLDHLDRPAIAATDAQVFAQKRRDAEAAREAERAVARQADTERVDQLRVWVQGLFDDGFARSKQPSYDRRIDDARKYASGKIYGRLTIEDANRVTIVKNDRGERIPLDDYPWAEPPRAGAMWKETVQS